MARRMATMTYPEVPDWKAFTDLRARHLDLQDRYRDAAQDSDRLDRTRDQALEADRDAYAQALIDGKPDPGQKHTQKHDQEAAAKRREMEALRLAVQRTEDEIQDLLGADGKERLEALQAGMADDRAKAQALLDDLAAAMEDLGACQAVAAWLQRAMNDYQPRAFTGTGPGMGRVQGLKRPNGEDHITTDVLAALRATLEGPQPPKARQPGEHVALQEQNWGEVQAALPQTAKGLR